MKRDTISALYQAGQTVNQKQVTLGGWVRSIRHSKDVGFIDLNDGSCFRSAQIVLERSTLDCFDEIVKQNVGAALWVTGRVEVTPGNRQPFEIKAEKVAVEGASTADYPLQKKRHSVEYLREQAYLRPRTNLFSAVFRVRSEAAFAIHQFFHSRGFVYVHTPLITGSDCEGAGEMFRVTTLEMDGSTPDWSRDFFGKSTHLTVSGQLEGETYAQAFGKIYTFGPTFRAEHSNTARHAAEFWMIEPEIAFADLDDVITLAWEMVQEVVSYVLEHCREELNFFNSYVDGTLLERLEQLCSSQYCRITYTEAIALLEESKADFQYSPAWGKDLQTEHERYLTEQVFHAPVFVTDYPKEIKSF